MRQRKCQLLGGKKDGLIFEVPEPLKKYLQFSPEPGEDAPDIEPSSLLPHLIYIYNGKRKSKTDNLSYETYSYMSRKK